MKAVNTIIKIVIALMAVAGAVYVIATYGDKIVAWAKELMAKCQCCKCCEGSCEEICEEVCEAAEEAAEEAVAEASEAPAVEIPDDGTPVADESDFVG